MVSLNLLVVFLIASQVPPVPGRPKNNARTLDDFDWKHHNYAETTAMLQHFAKQYPKITHLYSIGDSVEGRKLWVMALSDKPAQHEAGEPEVKYIANMHGNEVVGKELLLRLVKEFCENYGKDKNLTAMVDNTRIHLMPSMNPDGYELASSNPKRDWILGRSNAHNVDLNRNFPDQFFKSVTGPPQPETLAVMKWIKSNPFVLSANLHGGSLVANYPLDDNPTGRSTYSKSEDDDVFQHLAKTYSENHPTMHMKNPPWPCPDVPPDHFNDGVTNGAAWYSVSGGMQDYNYVHSNCFEITVEQGCQKWPKAAELPKFWAENRKPLLAYLDEAHKGIKGFVKDEKDAPIIGATIAVEGHKKGIITASKGDYWRLMLPGQYKVTASAKGFAPVTKTIIVKAGLAQQLNFNLKVSDNSAAETTQDEPNPVEDSRPSPQEGAQPYQVQASPQMTPMAVPGMGGSMMGGNMNLGNYGYGLQGGGFGGGFGETEGTYGGGFGGNVLNGGFADGYGINMMNNPDNSPGGLHLNLGGRVARVAGYGASKVTPSLGNNLELSGPLQDGALDRLAMMSPYETQSKDTEDAPFNVLTEEKSQYK